ncbi:MAG: cyclic pyranopterin monophosphate synthase MoaC, partial [Candidatus Dadabacteria bacterium]|nr:cyclic pyranopterin monophosphate synthase MoaC [Candidatus Dadabacteria bacterium]
MKDVSSKLETLRTAKARAKIRACAEALDLVRSNAVPKGNVLETARAAGIMAAKKTPELIPLCHQIPLDTADIEFEIEEDGIAVTSFVKAIWKTGVEMEALTAVSVAALTIYDMLKPLDTSLEICEIKLVEKKGGKS